MSDTASVVSGAYERFFERAPAREGSRSRGTASVRGPSADHLRQFWVMESKHMHGDAGSVSPDDVRTQYDALMRLFGTVTHRDDAGSIGTQGFANYTVPGWIGGSQVLSHEDALCTFGSGQDLHTALHHSARTVPHLLPGSNLGVAVLPYDDQDLQDALADLNGLNEEASEEDLPEPDPEAVENARVLLPRLFDIHPVRYQVSPTERRGVAIDAPMRRGAAVGVECAPDDTVYCFAAIDGNSRRAKFYQMDGLPDVFIAKALHDLAAG